MSLSKDNTNCCHHRVKSGALVKYILSLMTPIWRMDHIHFFVFLCFYIQHFQLCFGLNLLVFIRVFKVYQVSSVSVIFLTKASQRTIYNVEYVWYICFKGVVHLFWKTLFTVNQPIHDGDCRITETKDYVYVSRNLSDIYSPCSPDKWGKLCHHTQQKRRLPLSHEIT
jgi:hypothetical protein